MDAHAGYFEIFQIVLNEVAFQTDLDGLRRVRVQVTLVGDSRWKKLLADVCGDPCEERNHVNNRPVVKNLYTSVPLHSLAGPLKRFIAFVESLTADRSTARAECARGSELDA